MITLIRTNNVYEIDQSLIEQIYENHSYTCKSTVDSYIISLIKIFVGIKNHFIHARGFILSAGMESPVWLERLQRAMIDDYIFERRL